MVIDSATSATTTETIDVASNPKWVSCFSSGEDEQQTSGLELRHEMAADAVNRQQQQPDS